MSLNEWGDFLTGVVSPIAFLWLILGYLQQGIELKMNTEALRLQKEEIDRQIEATKALVKQAELQAKALIALAREANSPPFARREETLL